MILDHYVTFNFTTLKPNTPGYNFSVWANAPPGSSVKTSELIVAAQGMYIHQNGEIKCSFSPSLHGVQTHNHNAHLPRVFMSHVCSTGPSVKYSYDIAMVHRAGSQQAVLLLTGLV